MLQPPFWILFFLSILTLSAAALSPDAASLVAFQSKADLDNVLPYATADQSNHCQWPGVKCAGGRVVRYSLPSFSLRGTVPAATLSRLLHLEVLNLKNNSLFGPLPDFSPLTNLETLILNHNSFTGTFPLSILPLHRLSVLDLSHNNFTGPLPGNLTALDRLGSLRLDSNWFSGSIPPLNQTTLELFNVSYNNLSGPIPVTPTLRKFESFSFLHNRNLCGEIINKPCRNSPFFNLSSAAAAPQRTVISQNVQSQQGLSAISSKKRHQNLGLILGLLIGSLILTAAILSLLTLLSRNRKRREEAEQQFEPKQETHCPDETAEKLMCPKPERVVKSGSLIFCSGEEELCTLEQLMRASAELLGRGSLGTTYKAVMANQLVVSVKRLAACKTAGTSGEAFEQHMEAVGVLRHPNLVPVRAYFQAEQERLIMFDYQPNGSLLSLIYDSSSIESKPLCWKSCLKIAEDVAQGLAYIHQASRFIHGNLKPSNVLLGPDFEACITDYCLSILAEASPDSDSDAYRAPETRNSDHRATAKSDVYAYGVLLLEILSGKPPSLHPSLALRKDYNDNARHRMLVEVAGVCVLASPEQRPTMWQVLKMIANIKNIVDDDSSKKQHNAVK